MRVLPSFPRHFDPGHPKFGLPEKTLFQHNPEAWPGIWFWPTARVTGQVRVLATSRAGVRQMMTMPDGRFGLDEVGGGDLASLDVFFGHGWLVSDPVFFFHPSRRTSIIEYRRDAYGMDWRFASWEGMDRAGNATHAHLINPHREFWLGEVVEIDFFTVDIYGMHEDGSLEKLAGGNYKFGTFDCPWVIDAARLLRSTSRLPFSHAQWAR